MGGGWGGRGTAAVLKRTAIKMGGPSVGKGRRGTGEDRGFAGKDIGDIRKADKGCWKDTEEDKDCWKDTGENKGLLEEG